MKNAVVSLFVVFFGFACAPTTPAVAPADAHEFQVCRDWNFTAKGCERFEGTEPYEAWRQEREASIAQETAAIEAKSTASSTPKKVKVSTTIYYASPAPQKADESKYCRRIPTDRAALFLAGREPVEIAKGEALSYRSTTLPAYRSEPEILALYEEEGGAVEFTTLKVRELCEGELASFPETEPGNFFHGFNGGWRLLAPLQQEREAKQSALEAQKAKALEEVRQREADPANAETRHKKW